MSTLQISVYSLLIHTVVRDVQQEGGPPRAAARVLLVKVPFFLKVLKLYFTA